MAQLVKSLPHNHEELNSNLGIVLARAVISVVAQWDMETGILLKACDPDCLTHLVKLQASGRPCLREKVKGTEEPHLRCPLTSTCVLAMCALT